MQKPKAPNERLISKRIFLMLAGSIGGMLLLISVWIYLYFFLQSRAKEIAEIKQQNSHISQVVSNLSELKRESREASVLLPKLEKFLPAEEDVLFVTRELQAISKDIGINQVVALGEVFPPSGDTPRSISFSLNMNGRLEQFFEYLKRVENLPYSLELSNVKLSDDDGDGVLQVNASGRIFIR